MVCDEAMSALNFPLLSLILLDVCACVVRGRLGWVRRGLVVERYVVGQET